MSMHGPQEDVAISLDSALKALANPTRRHIVSTLLQIPGGQVASCAAFKLTISRSTLTQHMKVLHDAGLVETIDRGNRVLVELRAPQIDQRLPGLLDLIRLGA
jgi:DNA-binding transcriptional ArsR family regulator